VLIAVGGFTPTRSQVLRVHNAKLIQRRRWAAHHPYASATLVMVELTGNVLRVPQERAKVTLLPPNAHYVLLENILILILLQAV